MSLHAAMVATTPEGYLGFCNTCGSRALMFVAERGTAQEWCDQHERAARTGYLNPRVRPGLPKLEQQYRENSENPVYTEAERLLWKQLADELAERDKPKHYEMEGQMQLFPDEKESKP